MNQTIKNIAAVALLATAGLASAATVTLTGTVRDFNSDGVNFEGRTGFGAGWVQNTLTGASPTLTTLGANNISNTGDGAFSNWYTRATNSTSYSVTLNETSAGSGIYKFSSNAFFPIDGQLLGNQGRSHNYHFTYAISTTFGYTKGAGQTFSFTGDDDVWVYFDKLLGVDLGGVHTAQSQTVNLDTLFNAAGGRASGNYSFDFFFNERHTVDSNLAITTSLNLVSNNSTVPEPGSLALLGLGLIGLAAVRKRKQG